MKQYIEGDKEIIEFDNGSKITMAIGLSEPVPIEPQPTLQEQVSQLQQDNLILMDALATTFEQVLILAAKIDAMGGNA